MCPHLQTKSTLFSFWKIIVLIVSIWFLSSCTENLIDESTSKAEHESVEYKGLKVNHNYQSTLQSFDYTIEDYQNLLLEEVNSTTNSSGRIYSTTEDVEAVLIWELIGAIAESHLSKYPNVWDMAEDDYALLKSNFPTLSDEELEQNLDIIDQYYENNLRYDIVISLADTLGIVGSSENRRIEGGCYDGDGSSLSDKATCSKEVWFGIWHSQAVKDIENASDKAFKYERNLYGENLAYTKSDAFRHSIWNTLIAKYYAERKKDVTRGLEIAKKFTDLHEECNKECGSEDYDIAMDLHNNFVGRDYFKNNASIKKTGKWPFKKKKLSTLTDEQFKVGTKSKADIAIKVAKNKTTINNTNNLNLVYFD